MSDVFIIAQTDFVGGNIVFGSVPILIMAFRHIFSEFLTNIRNSCAASAVLAQATQAPTGVNGSSFI